MICGRYERKNQFAVFGLYRDDTLDAPLANEWSVDRKDPALTTVNERVKAATSGWCSENVASLGLALCIPMGLTQTQLTSRHRNAGTKWGAIALKLKRESVVMSVFLGGLAAIAPLAIDMGLPGFSATAAALGQPARRMPETLSLFLIAFSIGPLVLGTLADRFGRRPILLVGLTIFVLGGLGAATATQFQTLLISLTVQGIGAGVAATIPFAIARDLYRGDEARVRMSAMSLVLFLGPIVAPVLGNLALLAGGWRAIYGVLAGAGLIFLTTTLLSFTESASTLASRLTIGTTLNSYRTALSNKQFLGNTFVNACGFAMMFAYISGSPAILMVNFKLSSGQYSLIFGLTAGAMMIGSFINGQLIQRGVASRPIATAANLLMAVAASLLVFLATLDLVDPVALAVIVAVTLLGLGLLAPIVTHDALEPMGHLAGVATAVLRAIQMAMAGISSALVGFFYDGQTAFSMACIMAIFAIAAVVIRWCALGGDSLVRETTERL